MSEDLSRGDGEDDLRLFPVTSSRIDETWKKCQAYFQIFHSLEDSRRKKENTHAQEEE